MHHLLAIKNVKFQLNLFTQTIVTSAFVRSPQNVKCPVLGSRLFNPDNVYGLPGNSASNFLAPYPFFWLNSLIQTRSPAKTPFCYCTLLVYPKYTAIYSTAVTSTSKQLKCDK